MTAWSLFQVALVITIAAAFVYLAGLTGATVVCALRAGGRREEPLADEDALATSRFTVPVSVIIPVSGSNPDLRDGIARALALDYPELEVIVVADRMPPDDLTDLEREWHLSPCEYFFRQALTTATVRRIFRSTVHHHLIVVEKEPTGLADAMNCGVNLAQYRYVVVLDPAIVYDREALLRACAPALRDPERVVAVSTHLERVSVAGRSERVMASSWRDRFERLASLRSLLETRLAWIGFRPGLSARDSVIVWRRDALIGAGGFAPDSDWTAGTLMNVLAQPSFEGRVVRHGELFGRVTPSALTSMADAAAQRQRAVSQTTAVPLVTSEVLPVFAVAWLAVAAPVAAAVGALSWLDVPAIYLALSFGRALQSTSALLIRGALPGGPDGTELRRLLLAAPFELVAYSVPQTALRTLVR